MTTTIALWLILLCIGILTYATRLSFILLFGRGRGASIPSACPALCADCRPFCYHSSSAFDKWKHALPIFTQHSLDRRCGRYSGGMAHKKYTTDHHRGYGCFMAATVRVDDWPDPWTFSKEILASDHSYQHDWRT